jgi:hypothetical protein
MNRTRLIDYLNHRSSVPFGYLISMRLPSWITDPAKFRRVNGWLTVFWIVMIPVSILTGWVTLIEYVSALSIYALVTGHLSTWQAARVEERQENDQTEEIVRKIMKYLKESDQV